MKSWTLSIVVFFVALTQTVHASSGVGLVMAQQKARVTGDQVRKGIAEYNKDGSMDSVSQTVMASFLACEQVMDGSPMVLDIGAYLQYLMSHPIRSSYAISSKLSSTVEYGTDLILKETANKNLMANEAQILDQILRGFNGSVNLCSELAGQALIEGQVLTDLVSQVQKQFKNGDKYPTDQQFDQFAKLNVTCSSFDNLRGDNGMAELGKLAEQRSQQKYGHELVYKPEYVINVLRAFHTLVIQKLENCGDLDKAVNQLVEQLADGSEAMRAQVRLFGLGNI